MQATCGCCYEWDSKRRNGISKEYIQRAKENALRNTACNYFQSNCEGEYFHIKVLINQLARYLERNAW